MQTEWNENRIVLHGRVCQAPVPSHTNHGESYLKFPLAVCRLSGAEDRVNVVASAALLERCPLTEGEELSVEGEVRSFNNRSGVGSRLVISVYARQMHREPGGGGEPPAADGHSVQGTGVPQDPAGPGHL